MRRGANVASGEGAPTGRGALGEPARRRIAWPPGSAGRSAPTWRRLRALAGAPARLYFRKIWAQLAWSYLLVVLLTVVLAEVGGLLFILGIAPRWERSDDLTVDYFLGTRLQTAAYMVGPDSVAALAEGEAAGAARAAVDERLDRVVAGGAVGSDCTQRTGRWEPRMAVCGVTAAAVVGPDGTVLASTDPTWAAPGEPAADLPAPAGSVVTRTLALAGRPSDWGEPFVLDVVDRVTAGAYPMLADDGRLVGVLVGRGAPLSPIGDVSVREFLWGLLRSNLYVLPLFALPALLVGIPVGIWRARVLGRRLARLAAAADAVAGGDLARRVAIGRPDEIGRLGGRFNDLAAALASSDAARRRFMADVSHDLRTPIAIVQGNLERLLGDDAPTNAGDGPEATPGAATAGAPSAVDGAPAAVVPAAALAAVPSPAPRSAGEPRSAPERADQTAALRVMHRETLTLGRLIDDLFTLARLEEASLPVKPVALRLDRVAGEAVAGVRSVAWGARKVEVRSLVRPELPAVLADPTRLRQIFGNLLHNALRHTPEGGVIVVDAALVAPGPGATPEGGGPGVEVSVADTGVGIPPAELDAVFDRFFQVGGGRTGGGAGLGLHIVRQLVEAQRGTIRVESRLGEGTVFRFTLPVA